MLHKADIGCNLKSFLPSSQGRPKIPGTPWLFSRVGSVFPVNYAGKCPPHRCQLLLLLYCNYYPFIRSNIIIENLTTIFIMKFHAVDDQNLFLSQFTLILFCFFQGLGVGCGLCLMNICLFPEIPVVKCPFLLMRSMLEAGTKTKLWEFENGNRLGLGSRP